MSVRGGRLLMAVRDRRPLPLSACRSSMQAGHLGTGAGLVNEHQRVQEVPQASDADTDPSPCKVAPQGGQRDVRLSSPTHLG